MASKKITSLNILNNPKLTTKSILEDKIRMIITSNNPKSKNSKNLSKLTLLKKLRSKIIDTESNIIASPQSILKNQKLKNIKSQKNLINKTISNFQKENSLINNNSSNFRSPNPYLPLNNFTYTNHRVPSSLTGNRKISLSPEIIQNYNLMVQNIINSNNNIDSRLNQLNKIKTSITNSKINNSSKNKLISKINSVQQMFYQMF